MPIINIKSLILLIVALLNLSLGILVFFKNRKDKINIYYAFTAWSTAGWAFGLAMFYIEGDLNIAMLWYRLVAYVAAALIGASFLSFSFVFPFVKEKPKTIFKILFFIFTAFILIITAWPKLIISRIVEGPWGKGGELTIFYNFYATFFIMCMIGAFGNFIQKYKSADESQKIQIKYVFAGTLAAAIWGTLCNLFLPWFKIYALMWAGPYFTVVMVGLIAYAVLKHHLMNIKVIATDFSVGIMGAVLLIVPFFMPSDLLRLLTGAIFLLFCIFGYYLIKTTYEQARRKEEAQRTAIQERFSKEEAIWSARQLQRFNETLEQSVKLRTKELEEAKNIAEQKAKEAEKAKEELEKFYRLTVGREIRMSELKGKIKEMEERLKDDS